METINPLKEKYVFYIKADNGNSMVIIDKDEYYSKMNETIENSTFKTLPKIIQETLPIITELSNDFSVSKWHLFAPVLYGPSRKHKPEKKMRPIIFNINASAYLYNIAKFVINEFDKLPGPSGNYVKNRYEFVNKLEGKESSLRKMKS